MVNRDDFALPHAEGSSREPWYFGMAAFYAWIIVAVAFAVLTIGPGVMVVLGVKMGGEWSWFAPLTTFLLYFLPAALALFFVAALIFLFVDMARSLRDIRRQTRR